MSRNKLNLLNDNLVWNAKRRYKINAVVSKDSVIYQNISGINSDPSLLVDWVEVKGSSDSGSSISTQEFVFLGGLQEFVTTNPIAQVLIVLRNGKGRIPYTYTTTKVTITSTLSPDDEITVIYASEPIGISPYYTKAEVDNLIPQNQKRRRYITYFAANDIAQNTVLVGNFVCLLTKAYKIVEVSVVFGEQSMNTNKIIPIEIKTIDTALVAPTATLQYTANVNAVVGAIQNKDYIFTPNVTLPINKLLTVNTGAFTASTQILRNCLVTITLEEV
jgi:hypothetical protein